MITSLRFGLLLTLLAVTAFYAVLHFRVLQIAHPITQDEPGFIENTAAGNSFTHDGVLTCGNVYGPGYAVWARPFTVLVANPYIAHRWASSVALFAMLGVLGWVLRREGVGGIETAAGLAIVYILHASSQSLSASPDLLGAALYVAALAVSRRGTWPALLGGLALTIMAALTKPYFAFAWVIIVSHQLLFGSPRKAIALLGVSALAALLTVGLLAAFAPYYRLSTVVWQSITEMRRAEILLSQSAEFALQVGGILLLALLVRPPRYSFTPAWRTPLVTPGLDFWAWATLLAAIILVTSLGWHAGNYLVYYYHLLLGPLVIVALRRVPAWPRVGRALLCVNLLVLGWLLPSLPSDDHWDKLGADVAATHGPILADPLLEPFACSHPGLELFSHGQTATILTALDQLGPAVPQRYTGVHQELLQHAAKQTARIRAREFSAIYVSYIYHREGRQAWSYDRRHTLDALFASYQPVDEILFYPYAAPYWNRSGHGHFAYHVVKWVPK